MFFLMICHHRTNIAGLRDELRPLHREWVASGGNGLAKVLTGSAIWSPDGQAIGNFGLLEAVDAASARSFAEGDPFALGGVIASIDIQRLADTFQADRITPMTRTDTTSR